MTGEIVQPSPEPDAAAATGTSGDKAAAPPPPPEQSAGTGGLGTAAEQQSGGAPSADGPHDLTDSGPTDPEQPPRSPSGT